VSVHGAAYDSAELSQHPASKCEPGTRKQVLAVINRWVVKPDGRPICWLYGPAGSGKSSIARTIAESCDSQGVLAASFFFYRGHAERSSSHRLFTTIAYQLSISIPNLKSSIFETLLNDPSIPNKTTLYQLQKLIIDPFFTFRHPLTLRRVIVIDALDECEDRNSAKDVLTCIIEAFRQYHLPLQFIITSRPEFHIRSKFKELATQAITNTIDLHEFDAGNDIRVFLTRRFAKIYQDHSDVMSDVPTPWPSREDSDRLVEESSNLFIFASTLVNFIDDPDEHPNRRLAIVLQAFKGKYTANSSPYAGLDKLYSQILSMTSSIDRLRLVLGTIVLLAEPLSIEGLGQLLQLEIGDVRLALRGLYSVLSIPDHSREPVDTLHKSLHDFLTDRKRSEIYYVDPAICHTDLAHACLVLMFRQLRRDICGIGDPSKLNSEVVGLDQRRGEHIGGGLRYACCRWAYHISRAVHDNRVLVELKAFTFQSILYWIETLSVLGGLDSAEPSIAQAIQWVQVSHFVAV
jgi:hypothetical protein